MALTKIPGNLIEAGAITAASLDNDAVTTTKILDANITHAKLHTSMDLTGKTVTVATAAGGTNTTAAASTAFVQQELTTLIDGAPGTLDTLNELAAAINDDANYNSTLTTALATKLPLTGGTLTGALDVGGTITGDDGLSIQGGTGNAYLQVGSDTGSWTWKNYRATHKLALEDSDGTGEVLNFDTSGNATFTGATYIGGATSDWIDSNDELVVNGRGGFKGAGHTAAAFGRYDSGYSSGENGGIIDFLYGGGGIGSIGAEGGDSVYIQGGTSSGAGLLLHGTAGKVLPVRNTASIDATIDLGQGSRRFKDLYLSGNVQMGGNLDVVGQISSYDNVGASYGTMNFRATDYIYKNGGGTIKMTLDSAGRLLAGTVSPGARSAHTFARTGAFAAEVLQQQTSAGASVLGLTYDGAAPNNTTDYFIYARDTAGIKHLVRANGDGYFAGKVGIGTDAPTANLEIAAGGPTLTLNANTQATNKKKVRLAVSQHTAGDFNIQQMNDDGTTIAQQALLITNAGDIAVGGTGAPNAPTQKANTTITSSNSLTGTWTAPVAGGTYNYRNSIETAGILNRHIGKWGFSGNFSANTWYPFVKRSELTSMYRAASGSEDGFTLYFRIYLYPTTSGMSEYFSNRMSEMIYIQSSGSNSVTWHELRVGAGWGHAPNAGTDFDPDGRFSGFGPVRLRINHHLGSDANFPAEQTIDINFNTALTGLNPTVAGRQVLIYGYML